MKKLISLRFILSVTVFVIICTPSLNSRAMDSTGVPVAGSKLLKHAPKVYIDCNQCDMDYIRTEAAFVNYVRDSKDAQVHVLITTRSTGSSGTEYSLLFSGQKEFEGVNNELKYFSKNSDTSDEVREGLARYLKIGLVSYVARTPVADMLTVSFKEEDIKTVETKDKWNYWVFSVSGRGYINGEKTSRYHSLNGSFSANRVTPEFKFRASYSINRSKDEFDFGDDTYESTSRSQYLNILAVKSINDHWSIGAGLSANASSYSNIRYAINPAPALEYNFFPYSESTRRQLRFLWKPGLYSYHYDEETIFDKTSENLWGQTLSIAFEMKEKWGDVSSALEGFHYFDDSKKNHLQLSTDVSIRLFRGLSLTMYGGVTRVRDRISLPQGDATLEEVLLRQTQLDTGYTYYASIGLSYSFGSIYSNVVNPRFNGY